VTILNTQPTVAATAVPLAAHPGGFTPTRVKISNGAAVIYLGGSTVTTGNGVAVPINGITDVTLVNGEVLYAVSATSSVVGVLHEGL
jgi:hypothetical protein